MPARGLRGLLVAAALVAGVAGCGGGGGSAAKRPERRPPARTAVTITAPRPSTGATGVPLGDGRLRSKVTVTGLAAPGQQITVGSQCPPKDCEVIAFADERGHWRTTLRITFNDDVRRIELRAEYDEPRRGELPATTSVRIHLPRPQALPGATGGGESEGAPYTGPHTLIVIGDSLAVGMAPQLAADLRDWTVTTNARIGRPLAEGMRILAQTQLPPGAAGSHTVLAFSLFTNDSPTSLDALEAAVRASVARLGPHGCAIWATISRPPFNGVTYDAANARLERLAADPKLSSKLLLVPWAEVVAEHPQLIGPDHVHGTPEGYQVRAQLYAQAAQFCAS